MKQAQTLGRLRKSGWLSRTVKEEIRQNAIKRIQQGEELFPGVLGYEKGFDDYLRFQRKHKQLYGVGDDGAIEKGVGHVA